MIRCLLQARRALDPPQRQLRQQQNNVPTPLRRQRLPKGLRRGAAHDAIQASTRLREAPCSPESATRGILSTYKRHLLWDIERAFRTSKSLFETRPIYHKLDETIRGHVSCSFLALVLKKELEDRIAAMGEVAPSASWPEILADLDSLTETEVEQDGKRFVLRSPPRPAASLALRAAGVALPPTVRQLPAA
jgi:hypothetical protein